ncbi:winged helix-turn-helix domain-containing protein [Saccharopolyspora sp. ASAGF58]|uniref:winged helix-turn-helix domain-containing protein n=1 Tax=Saccharopolyspora sp. ASAGF58 TaxID=2719023 RepID=UPI00144852FC|nr:winged helix-turn-helix domain-containing protein [Saccharopolyspora sp. ASAGF58]
MQSHFGSAAFGWGAVAELIRARHGVVLSLRTVGDYLRCWGVSPQRPIRRAYERDPEAVRRWGEEDYPAIVARACREGAVIVWLDQTRDPLGCRSGPNLGTGRPDTGGGQDRGNGSA